jgi:hypothetical protein
LRRVEVALSTSLDVIRGGKYDPFDENYLIKAVSKLNAMFLFNTSPYSQVLTTKALRALLYDIIGFACLSTFLIVVLLGGNISVVVSETGDNKICVWQEC